MRVTKIWVRLLILSLGLVGPVLMLVYMLAAEQAGTIEFSAAERRGVEYHRPAWSVLKGLTEHRTIAAMVISGNHAKRDGMLAKQREIDSAFAKMVEVDGRLGAEMKTTELLKDVQSGWTAMKSRLAQPESMDLQALMGQYNQLIYDMGRVITKMGNHSNLILDPDIDTYYLMDATQFKLPRLLDQLTQIQAIGAAAQSRPVTEGDAITTLERAQIANAATRADEYLREGLTNLEYAFDANSDVRAGLGGSAQLTQSAVAEMLAESSRKGSASMSGGVDAWLTATDKAVGPTAALFDTSLANLDQYLAIRIAGLSTTRTLDLVGALVLTLLALTLTAAISRSIVVPVYQLRNVADKISLGDLTERIDIGGTDEVADLARTVSRMQESLKIAALQAGEL